MSARVSRCASSRGAGPSSQKRMVFGVDLNVPASDHFHFGEVDGSTYAPVVPVMRGEQQRFRPPPVTIDVDTIDDDDVVLSSPRAFAEARNNSRRGRSRSNVIDVDLESSNGDFSNNRNKRQRVPENQPIIDCESHVALERNNDNLIECGRYLLAQSRKFLASPPPPPPLPPPPEPSFSCPICMGPLVEEMSTKCGHIFCKECIKKALSVQSKCPTCRKKVTMRGTIRVYLPKTS